MKHFYAFISVLGMVMLASLFASCNEEFVPGPSEPTDMFAVNYSDDNISTTSATFDVSASAAYEVAAYPVLASDATEELDGAMIFTNAETAGTVGTTTAGTSQITIDGLDGNTAYTVWFAAKVADDYKVEKKEITTKNYDKMVTVIKATKNSVKFHIEVPEGTYYRYVLIPDMTMYHMMKDEYMNTDIDFLSYGAAMDQGPKTFTITDGDVLDEEEGDLYSVKPGTAMGVMMAECDAEGVVKVDYDDGGGIMPLARSKKASPNLGDYSEECEDYGVIMQGLFAKQFFWTEAPEVGADKIEISTVKLNARSAVFKVTPPESVISFGAVIFSEEEWEYYKNMVGEDGMQAFCLANSEQGVGETILDYSGNLTLGQNYYISVVGVNDDKGYSQVWTVQKFALKESELPESELVITPITLSEELQSGFVAFNIKAPNKDCHGIRYLMNYTKEWVKQINAGNTYESMLSMYGVDVTDANEVALVNSDEGYNVTFDSDPNIESTIAVGSYNADESISKCFIGKARTADIPDKELVASSLYADLEGDWTITYKAATGSVIKAKMHLSQNIADGPKSWNDFAGTSQYNDLMEYFKNDESKVKELFNEYQTLEQKYSKKYKGQNWIVGTVRDSFLPYVTYKSAWDLFCDLDYSAYDTDELFYDYGPKMFFEVVNGSNGPELVLQNDMTKLPPMFNAGANYYWLPCNAENNYYWTEATYPVEVSADKNTLTVKPFVLQGLNYYPAGIRMYGQYPFIQLSTTEDIVITRGAEASIAPKKMAEVKANGPAVAKTNHLKKTRMPLGNKKVAHMKLSKADVKAAAKAQHSKMNKR